MAQRGTGFARKPAAPEVVRVEAPPRPIPQEAAPSDPIPLDLAPLIAPYRKHGRLSLRVERLPHRARLSRGQNNGDRSFSLAPDDLDGVLYLPPNGATEMPTLAVRIISLDGGDGATLALLDYVVSAETLPERTADPDENRELRRLHDELAKLKSSLEARDAELAEAQRTADTAKAELPKQTIEAELAAMRETWEAEVEGRVATAVADAVAKIEKSNATSRATEDARLSKSEKRTQIQLAQERERLQKDADAALKKAEKDWKAAEAARLAVAEAQWQKRSEKALADVQAQFEKSKVRTPTESRVPDAELRRLQDELTKTKASLSERDVALTRERAASKQIRDEASKLRSADSEREQLRDALEKSKASLAERDAALAREQSSAKQMREEAGKLRGADSEREQLRDSLEKSKTSLTERDIDLARAKQDAQNQHKSDEAKLSQLAGELGKAKATLSARESELEQLRSGTQKARAEADTLRGDSAALKRISNELAAIKASLAVRDAELARSRASNEDTRQRGRQDAAAALSEAEARWKEAEAGHLAAAEAQWRKHSDLAIAEVVARLDTAEADAREDADRHAKGDAELARLRNDHGTLKTLLHERENDLVQTKLGHQQARERWMQETETALQKAQQSWKVSEAARIATSESFAHDQNTIALSETSARLKQTESLLAEARGQVETLRHRGDAEDVARLRKDFAGLQATLARREQELMDLRSDHENERARWTVEARTTVQRADQHWKEDDTEELERAARAQSIRVLIRNVVLAAAFAGLAFLGYYKIAPMVSEQASNALDLGQDDTSSSPAVPAKSAEKPTLAVLRSVNLRAGASTSSAVIGSVPRDAKVTVLARRDKWMRVEMTGAGHKPQQGWIYSSFLGAPAKSVKAPSSVPSK
jgi:Bacterial SH3 domain